MASGPDQLRLTPDERADLVAYLDGELGDQAHQRIAEKLTQSVTARRESESLQKTWDLLGALNLPQASEEFTRTTLTRLGRLETSRKESTQGVQKLFSQLARGLLVLIGLLLGFLISCVAAYHFSSAASSRLAREKMIAEHLDEYQDLPSFELLQELAKEPEILIQHQ